MTTLELTIFTYLLYGGLAIGAIVFCALFFLSAPYGRHARKGWGPSIPSVLGWMMMEVPAAVGFALFFLLGTGFAPSPVWVFLLMWELHYLYRGLVYSWRIWSPGKRMPLLIVSFGILFNLWNTYLNGRYLGVHGTAYTAAWFFDVRFLAGGLLFFAGLAVNLHADQLLIRLRKERGPGYHTPQGGLFRWVSCPNYLGEILEWWGWALATWSLPGVAFALWTMANLLPRARSHHRWCRERLPEYPEERKALIPFLF